MIYHRSNLQDHPLFHQIAIKIREGVHFDGCKFFVLSLNVVETKFEAIIGSLNNVTNQQKLLVKMEDLGVTDIL